MKSTYRALKTVNEQIAEFTAELAEINKWPDGADKRQAIEKHEHMISELYQSKLKRLKAHEWAIEQERQLTEKRIYEYSLRNQPA